MPLLDKHLPNPISGTNKCLSTNRLNIVSGMYLGVCLEVLQVGGKGEMQVVDDERDTNYLCCYCYGIQISGALGEEALPYKERSDMFSTGF